VSRPRGRRAHRAITWAALVWLVGAAAAAADPPAAVGAAPGGGTSGASPGVTDPPASFSNADILGAPPPYFRIQAFNVRYTHFDQSGTGYQSRAGPRGGPGSEALTVEQPQAEIIATQGERITHRVWIPVDIVTAASPDAIDVVSTASRTNEAASVDWTTTYKASPETSFSVRNGLHNEENWRSWNSGFGLTRAFAEDNTVLEASVNQITDWFDKYTLTGLHDGHTSRSTTSVSAGLTQLLSPTTVAHLDYGVTLQRGQLSNGWNIVPLTTGDIALEILPTTRVRHAFVGRVAQFLPWNGAAHAFYRFYVDSFGIRAHSLELELYQRLSRLTYLRLNYRFHRQTGADFFTTRVAPGFTVATADSDLAPFDAHTVGVKGSLDVPLHLAHFAKNLHVDLAVERYYRTNDLRVSVYSCGLGFLF